MNNLSLDSIGNGAAVELFDEELKKVLNDMTDVNKDPSSKREITLKLTISPSLSREQANYEISVNSKLGKLITYPGIIYFGKRGDKVVAREDAHIDQMTIAEVKPINEKEGTNND